MVRVKLILIVLLLLLICFFVKKCNSINNNMENFFSLELEEQIKKDFSDPKLTGCYVRTQNCKEGCATKVFDTGALNEKCRGNTGGKWVHFNEDCPKKKID